MSDPCSYTQICAVWGWPCQRDPECTDAPEKWRGQPLSWRLEYRDLDERLYGSDTPEVKGT